MNASPSQTRLSHIHAKEDCGFQELAMTLQANNV